jgi:hypothetical protein
LQFGITLEVVHKRFGPWYPVQVLWGLFAHLSQPMEDLGMKAWIGRMVGARAREEHLQIIGRGLAQTDFPFFDPANLASDGLSILGVGKVEGGDASGCASYDDHRSIGLPFHQNLLKTPTTVSNCFTP